MAGSVREGCGRASGWGEGREGGDSVPFLAIVPTVHSFPGWSLGVACPGDLVASFQLEGRALARFLHFVDISHGQGRVLDDQDVLALRRLS